MLPKIYYLVLFQMLSLSKLQLTEMYMFTIVAPHSAVTFTEKKDHLLQIHMNINKPCFMCRTSTEICFCTQDTYFYRSAYDGATFQ